MKKIKAFYFTKNNLSCYKKHYRNFEKGIKHNMTDKQIPFPADFDPTQLTELDDDYGVMELISAEKSDGTKAWAYITIKPSLYLEYTQKVINGESITLADYGQILQTGDGEAPPDIVREDMEERFGADHAFSERLKQQVQDYINHEKEKER